jgi:predicted Zn-dependent protease
VLAALNTGACAVNPVSGRPELVLVSAERERQLGDEEAKNVAATMGLVEDAALTAYVSDVGRRLAAVSPRRDIDYRFLVVDMSEANAFALPAGHVYVSRGLLVLLDSEAELAGILGHEIGHIAARHAVQRMSRAAPIGILTGVGAAVTGVVSPLMGNIIGGMGEMAGQLVLAPYSRDQEREADRVGAELLARAGWEPGGLAQALRTLEMEEKLAGGTPRRSSFFATHPALPERVETVTAQAATLARTERPGIAATRPEFVRRLDGLVVGPNAAEGVVVKGRFLHPDLDLAMTFPDGWKTHNERTAVGARSPDGRAMLMLDVAGDGDDPAAGVRALEQKTGTRLGDRVERIDVGGQRALRLITEARSDGDRLGVEITWIAISGRILRLTGAATAASFEAQQPAFRRTAASMRRLTAAERAGITERRLRLVPARRGEMIAQVSARARSTWKPDLAAVANGVAPGTILEDGYLVKIAVEEPYRPDGTRPR